MEWIRTKDQLPPEGEDVLCCFANGTIAVLVICNEHPDDTINLDGGPTWYEYDSGGGGASRLGLPAPSNWAEIELPNDQDGVG